MHITLAFFHKYLTETASYELDTKSTDLCSGHNWINNIGGILTNRL